VNRSENNETEIVPTAQQGVECSNEKGRLKEESFQKEGEKGQAGMK